MPEKFNSLQNLNKMLVDLGDSPEGRTKAITALDIAIELLSHFGLTSTSKSEEIVDEVLSLPRQNIYDSWFVEHPTFENQAACFEIPLPNNSLIQPKLYCLKKRSRLVISGAVAFTPNWEDEEYTRNDNHNVGIDFYLSPEQDSLIIALSDRGNVRVVELERHITNTQFEILKLWGGLASETNRAILHEKLWKSFELKSVNKLFYLEIAKYFDQLVDHLVNEDKNEDDAKLFASRLIGRLLFCWFLRKKEIISEKNNYFEVGELNSTEYYKHKLEVLFFDTLNQPIDGRRAISSINENLLGKDDETPYLNGGLFEPHENDFYQDEDLSFPPNFFRDLYTHFNQFNFTTDESSAEYEQVAIDPEMLGQIFESLLATQNDETGKQARKAKGSFYTPRAIVSFMCKESVRNYLYSKLDNESDTKNQIELLLDKSDKEWAINKDNWRRDIKKKNEILTALDGLKMVDPACGSGAFPMGIVQLLVQLYERLETRFDVEKTKLGILENNIYGIDIEPMAVEIARLRAWLSIVVEAKSQSDIKPLPNLDFKFVCANSLVPLDLDFGLFSDNDLHLKLMELRNKYFNARKPHKKKLLQEEFFKYIATEQTQLIVDDIRTKQLKSFNPFNNNHPSDFFDSNQMFGIENGFDIVIGNPPYGAKFSKTEKAFYKDLYSNVHVRTPDSFNYFIALAFLLAKPQGVVTYITSNNLLFQNEYIKARKIILTEKSPKKVINLGDNIFDSAIVPSCVLVMGNQNQPSAQCYDYLDLRDSIDKYDHVKLANNEQSSSISIASTLESPSYVFGISADGLALLNTLDLHTKPIDELVEEMASGVSTGGDKIFRLSKKDAISHELETNYLKPVLIGREINRYQINANDNYVLYLKRNVDTNKIPRILSYLEPSKMKLEERSETKSGILPWYALGRARYEKLFEEPKILLRQTGDKVIAVYDNQSFFALNSLLVLKLKHPDEAFYAFLEGYLNSKICNYVYSLIAQEAGRIFAEVKPKNIRKIPVPCIESLTERIAQVVYRIRKSENLDEIKLLQDEIDNALYEYFSLTNEQIRMIEKSS